MITFQVTRRPIKMQSFEKLIEELKEKTCRARIKLTSTQVNTPDAFLKVMWSGQAGILLQNEIDKQFVAIEDVYAIDSFVVNSTLLNFKPDREYYLK